MVEVSCQEEVLFSGLRVDVRGDEGKFDLLVEQLEVLTLTQIACRGE